MASQIFDNQIRDTQTYNSTDVSTPNETIVFQLVNTLDVSVDYTFEATYDGDSDWSDALTLETETASSGSVTREGISEPWDKVRATVTASSSPSNGKMTVYRHTP